MQRILLISIALLVKYAILAEKYELDTNIDISFKPFKTTAERVSEYGYPVETHTVETSDGYVINIFRIPYSPKLKNSNEKRPAVLIQHGFWLSSDCFVLNGPDNAIAYNLVDAGFDVWLGNSRGNVYARNNTKVSPNQQKFWEFSWHEIGAIDLPAIVDYILAETGEEKLHYVGHSQGTTVFFVMTSFLPEYNDKIKTAHMLAPSAYLGNATAAIHTIMGPYLGTHNTLVELIENREILPQNFYLQRALDTICNGQPKFPQFCSTLFLLLLDENNGNLNETLLPFVAETYPAGASINQAIHFLQSHASNEFRRYDYGVIKNLQYYQQAVPPSYDLTQITAEMYLYIGLSDNLATLKDCQRLPALLPNIKLFHVLPDPSWEHFDLIFANAVKENVNDKVIAASLAYENNKNFSN